MSDLVLSGALLGLIRKCSPLVRGDVVVVLFVGDNGQPDGTALIGADNGVMHTLPVEELELDLTEDTGILHAVWWVRAAEQPLTGSQMDAHYRVLGVTHLDMIDIYYRAEHRFPMTQRDREIVRDYAKRLALFKAVKLRTQADVRYHPVPGDYYRYPDGVREEVLSIDGDNIRVRLYSPGMVAGTGHEISDRTLASWSTKSPRGGVWVAVSPEDPTP